MRIYVGASVEAAKGIDEHGFAGRAMDLEAGGSIEVCEFRSAPPSGWDAMRTVEVDDEEASAEVVTSAVLFTDVGDFTISIDVPEDDLRHYETTETDPEGRVVAMPYREFFVPPEVANAHRYSLEVAVSETQEDVPVSLLRRDHAVFITERFGYWDAPAAFRADLGAGFRAYLDGEDLTPAQVELLEGDWPTIPAGAVCVCGERWRWDPSSQVEQIDQFVEWLADHHPEH